MRQRGHFKRQKNDNTVWTNPEEKRVIQGNETKTAKANKEIPLSKRSSRNNHKGTEVVVDGGPTSTTVNNTKTTEYAKKRNKAPLWTPEVDL